MLPVPGPASSSLRPVSQCREAATSGTQPPGELDIVSSLGRQCLLWDHTGASLRLLLCVEEQREVWLLPVGRWGQRGWGRLGEAREAELGGKPSHESLPPLHNLWRAARCFLTSSSSRPGLQHVETGSVGAIGSRRNGGAASTWEPPHPVLVRTRLSVALPAGAEGRARAAPIPAGRHGAFGKRGETTTKDRRKGQAPGVSFPGLRKPSG